MSQGELPAEGLVVAELVEASPSVQPTPWGLWMTLAFSLAVIVAFVAIQTAITIVFIVAQLPKTPITSEYACNGLLVSLATWAAASACLALVVLLIKLRKQLSVRDYLSLHRVSIGRFLAWASLLLIFIAITDGATWLLGRDVVPHFMIDSYRTAVIAPLFLASLWIAAPVFEEAFFRGFMFRGIQQSRLGNLGAILITAAVWSVIHLQYSAYEVAVIFLSGILLGVARATSNSVYLTIGLHSLMNVVATVELWVYLWLPS
ncbi:MAG: type II CAAX endopeptidase family protein [Thermoguttaceae bacterium]|jgi:membrane protease YdiL (CAAX protease family)